MFKDYYKILEVDISATDIQIKESYRKLIKKWHPDVCKHPDATAKSQEIIEAYLILSDEVARTKFDSEYKRYEDLKNRSKKAKAEEPHHRKYDKDDDYEEPENNFANSQGNDQAEEEFKFEDKTFEKWVENARNQARNFVDQAISDTIGVTKSGCLFTGKALFIAAIVFIVILLLISILSHGV